MSAYRWRVEHLTLNLVEHDDLIVRSIKAGKQFEPETLRTWVSLCAGGGTVVDVGAYTGAFSILAAKMGCRVIAFEPMPRNHVRCRENFRANGVEVDLREACATDQDGPVVIKFNPRVRGLTSGASLIRPSAGNQSRAHGAQGVTIDSLELETCAAIKIDVERGEPHVLRGARETLKRCAPMLLVEVLGEAEQRAVLEAAPGYRVVATLDKRNWLMVPQSLTEFWRAHGMRHITPRGLDRPEGWDVGGRLARLAGAAEVLDFGCGRGRLSGAFDPDRYVGYDINPAALSTARRVHPAHRFTSTCPAHAGVVLLYTVALHMSDDDLRGAIEEIEAPRWIIAEVMGRRWRNSQSIPPVFNREPEEYEAMFPGWRVAAESHPYEYYPGADLTIIEFSC